MFHVFLQQRQRIKKDTLEEPKSILLGVCEPSGDICLACPGQQRLKEKAVNQGIPETVTFLSPGDQGRAAGCIISKGNKHWQVYQLLESRKLEKTMSAEYSMLQLHMTQYIIDRN